MNRNILVIVLFLAIGIGSVALLPKLKFSFDFEQFFPKGDKDLDFYRQFVKEFETDDNFLLIAIERKEGIFDQQFLTNFHDFTLKSRDLPHVKESQSLTKFRYPVKTLFAITTIPSIHIEDTSLYAADKQKILQDERFVNNLISSDGTALIVLLKTDSGMQLEQATELVDSVQFLLNQYHFPSTHIMGRAYFQKEIVELTKREVTISTLIAGFLVSIVIGLIFRRVWGSVVALGAILLGLLIFLGILSLLGRELSALAALYPVLMLILGTFDVIHVMSKYTDERIRGLSSDEAVKITIKDMTLPTFLTYSTTAIGFLTLLGNNIQPIADFGINATIGVTVAYIIAIIFVPACLSFFELNQILKVTKETDRWKSSFHWLHFFTQRNPRMIALAGALIFGISLYGISLIKTNYRIEDNLPVGATVTTDFLYFEEKFAGFRPVEYAIMAQGDYKADDFEVLQQVDKIENHLRTYPTIRAITSMTAIYKSLNQMNGGGGKAAYKMPDNDTSFYEIQALSAKIPNSTLNVLRSKDEKKTRISTRVNDLGADSVKKQGERIDAWIAANTDSSIVKVRRTGTGMLVDKNGEYVRDNTVQGLFWSVLIISILMAFIFKQWQVMLVFLIPNLLPLFICGAFMGFYGIQLEAGVSIVFSVIFGIAVDDTIHTLSKLKAFRDKGNSIDDSLYHTMMEVGKPMIHTAIILFFGFMVMLFSANPPSQNVGILMSFTLASALISDMFLLPVMARWLMKK
jgi:predicted RND superfamily exporter protein